MNKELIKKHKAEFDHWLNGGKLLAKHNNKGWINYYGEDIWTHSAETLIVIDDEYSMFRKALIEGKIVQEQDYYSKQWFDMKTPDFHGASDTQYEGMYRIKPEELKFKVGDWVRDLRDNRIFQINSENFNLNLSITNGVYVHWQPKPGEWCWFWDFGNMPVLEQFRKYHDLNDHLGNYETLTIKLYQYCEPFIGQLPTNIKN